ncbi:MAG: hypothetical protein LBR39_08050 [Coriobacteriales bacterium]|jgi:hypothetical protein|nr:hypothetical protein [Coriobacteriales bacterium]
MTDDDRLLKNGILKAMKFEALYLINKSAYYDFLSNEDRMRIAMMQERIAVAESLL